MQWQVDPFAKIMEPLVGLLSLERLSFTLEHDGPRFAVTLPPGISRLSSLTYLCLPQTFCGRGTDFPWLSNNVLTVRRLREVLNLRELCLSLVGQVPSCIGRLQSLTQLRLSRVDSQDINVLSSLQECSGLTFLHLAHAKMTSDTAWQELGRSLQALTSLKCLMLVYVRYHPRHQASNGRFPRNITAISFSGLSELPPAIINHSSLVSLEVYGLKDLPQGPYLASLKYLKLQSFSSVQEISRLCLQAHKLCRLDLYGATDESVSEARQCLMQQVPANTWCHVRGGDLRSRVGTGTGQEDGPDYPWPFDGFGRHGQSICDDIYRALYASRW